MLGRQLVSYFERLATYTMFQLIYKPIDNSVQILRFRNTLAVCAIMDDIERVAEDPKTG